MKKYNGAIVEPDGAIVFEFTTRFCATHAEAETQANHILQAWRYSNVGEYYYTLEAQQS